MSCNSQRYLNAVRAHIDSMLDVGRNVADAPPCPLFVGVVDVGARDPITAMSPLPPGIRQADFNWAGNNLMHDLPTLEVMNHLTHDTQDNKYADAVDQMLLYYGQHCPDPDTGLFPWGEHAQWSVADACNLPCSFTHGLKHYQVDQYGIHDHLQYAPPWFWQQLGKHHPKAVHKFAQGLNGHIVNPQTMEHNRHAAMTSKWWRDPNTPPTDEPGKDFARHAGFYILDCAMAYQINGETAKDVLDWATRKLDYQLSHLTPQGLARGPIRTKAYDESVAQHDSLALSIWDAAQSLGPQSAQGQPFTKAAKQLLDARQKMLDQNELPALPQLPHIKQGQAWMTGYFRTPKHGFMPSNQYEILHQRLGHEKLTRLARRDANWVRQEAGLPPEQYPVMARSYHLAIDTCIAGYTLGKDPHALEYACDLADVALERLFRNDLLMGYSGLKVIWKHANGEIYQDPWVTPNTPGFYYSVSGTPCLTRTLYRLGRLLDGHDIGPDPYTR